MLAFAMRRLLPWALAASLPLGCAISFDGYVLSETDGGAGSTSSATTTSGVGASSTASGVTSTGGGYGGEGAVGGGSITASSATVSSSGSGGSPPSCPTDGGDMVAVPKPGGGDYCVDKTEVTQERYGDWLGSTPSTGGQIAECTGNTSFTPSCSFSPTNDPNHPVVCVDWCDAYAFCAAVGKRLCGNIGGGANSTAQATNPAESQWFRACSMDGSKDYPYGNLYGDAKCNGVDSPFAGVADVGTLLQCVGGYTGLYDMSGNAREWEDSCSGNQCVQRGGSWLDSDTPSPHSLRCDSDALEPRTQQSNEVGFRCCADLP